MIYLDTHLISLKINKLLFSSLIGLNYNSLNSILFHVFKKCNNLDSVMIYCLKAPSLRHCILVLFGFEPAWSLPLQHLCLLWPHFNCFDSLSCVTVFGPLMLCPVIRGTSSILPKQKREVLEEDIRVWCKILQKIYSKRFSRKKRMSLHKWITWIGTSVSLKRNWCVIKLASTGKYDQLFCRNFDKINSWENLSTNKIASKNEHWVALENV